MKLLHTCVLAIIGIILGSRTIARADTLLYSTFGPGDSYAAGPIGPELINTPSNPGYVTYEDIAVKFLVPGAPGQAYNLASVHAPMWYDGTVIPPGGFTVTAGTVSSVGLQVTSDNNGAPGSELEQSSLIVGSESIYDFPFSGNTTLTSGSTYWIVARESFGDVISGWAQNDHGLLGIGVYNGPQSFGYYDYDNPSERSDTTPAFSVYGTTVPEPATGVILSLGLTAWFVCWVHRIKVAWRRV